jgi:hypothetical protein
MTNLIKELHIDPIPTLLGSDDEVLVYFVRRDLEGDDLGPIESLWELPKVGKILAKQQPDGSWKYPSSRKGGYENENYDLLETYRQLRYLIDQFGIDRQHESIFRAAEYVLAHQSPEGDIRGIFGSQYAPHYTAGLLELLIRAGYVHEPEIEKCFSWLDKAKQDDGGWAWPLRTAKVKYEDAIIQDEPVQSDKTKPFAHALTGFVLRAYAAHPKYRSSSDAWNAGELMKSRFFKPDKYSDRKAVEYWTKFQFPFWWANLLTTLDSLSMIDFSREDEQAQKGLDWFSANQREDGLWPSGYGKGKKAQAMDGWVGLAICRMLKRFEGVGKAQKSIRQQERDQA